MIGLGKSRDTERRFCLYPGLWSGEVCREWPRVQRLRKIWGTAGPGCRASQVSFRAAVWIDDGAREGEMEAQEFSRGQVKTKMHFNQRHYKRERGVLQRLWDKARQAPQIPLGLIHFESYYPASRLPGCWVLVSSVEQQ